MSRPKIMLITFVMLILSLSMGPKADIISAQGGEVLAPEKVLQKTWIKTEDTPLMIETSYEDAFSPTSVECQGGGGCNGKDRGHLRVLELLNRRCYSNACNNRWVRGREEPNAVVNVDAPGAYTIETGIRTFSWMKKVVTRGLHTVTVEFGVT